MEIALAAIVVSVSGAVSAMIGYGLALVLWYNRLGEVQKEAKKRILYAIIGGAGGAGGALFGRMLTDYLGLLSTH